MTRVAIFGGSFNPPHVAHLLAAALVVATHDIDLLLVVPTFRHPFAKELAAFEARAKMCELAMGSLPKVGISRVEEELGGESRTLRTLEHLQKTNPSWQLRLVMGGDLVAESAKWHGFEAIRKIAPPLVIGRAGFADAKFGTDAAAPPLLPEISSTEIRKKISEGTWKELAPLVPRLVLDFIRAEHLYERI
ncbi:MAG: nicotinate (nicotinamide) nucleotide adenylyltransferase [Polyangiaceae bacterium]